MPADTSTISLLAPDGRILEADPDTAHIAVNSGGYSVATPEQITEHARKQRLVAEEGGALGQLKTFGEGAADALTFGGATHAETHLLDADPELIRLRSEINPIAHGIGTGVGIAAPLLLSGGTAAPAEAGLAGLGEGVIGAASKFTAPSLIAKAGHAASDWSRGVLTPGMEAALGGLTTEAAARAVPGLGRRLLIRGVPGAAGAALEGALYGLGDDIHESALGDPLISGESLGRIGLSALFAGGIGAGLGLSGGVADALKGALPKDLRTSIVDGLDEFAGGRGLKAAGGIQRDVKQLIKTKGYDRALEVGNGLFDEKIVGPGSTFKQSLERSLEVQAEAGETIGKMVDAADAVAKPVRGRSATLRAMYGDPIARPTAGADTFPTIEDLVARARKSIVGPLRAEPTLENAGNAVNKLLDGYEEKYKNGLTFNDLLQMKRHVSDEVYRYGKALDPLVMPTGQAMNQLRHLIERTLDSGIEGVGLDAEAWHNAEWRYEVAKTGQRFAETGIARELGNNKISPTEFLSILAGGGAAGPIGAIVTGAATAAIRRYGSGAAGALARSLRGALEAEVDDVGGIIGGGPRGGGGETPPESSMPSSGSPRKPSDTTLPKATAQDHDHDAWNKQIAELQEELRSRRKLRASYGADGGPAINEGTIDNSGAGMRAPSWSRAGGPNIRETALDIAAKDSSGVTRALKRVQDQQFAQALGLKELDAGTSKIIADAQKEGILGRFTGPERLIEQADAAASVLEQEIRTAGVEGSAGRARVEALGIARALKDRVEKVLAMPGAASRVSDRLAEDVGAQRPHTMHPGADAATASPEQGAALEVLRRTNERAQEALEAKASSMVADVAKGSVRSPNLGKLSTKEIQAQIEHLRTLAKNPVRLAADTHVRLHDMADHAPQTATNAAATMSRAVRELDAAAPQLPPPSIGNPEPELSRTHAVEFAKLQQAVEHPEKADWSDPAVWRIIKAVYPALAAKVASLVLQALPKHPTQHQIQLAAQITGMQLTPGSAPATQALFQQLMQTTPMKQPGKHGHSGSTSGLPKARLSKPGVGKMKIAESSATTADRAAEPV